MLDKLKEIFNKLKNKVTNPSDNTKAVASVAVVSVALYKSPERLVQAIFGACWVLFFVFAIINPIFNGGRSVRNEKIHPNCTRIYQ